MVGPASGTIMLAGDAPLGSKDPRLSDIPLCCLFPTPDTGRVYGEPMWSLKLFRTSETGPNHPLCWKQGLAWATTMPAHQNSMLRKASGLSIPRKAARDAQCILGQPVSKAHPSTGEEPVGSGWALPRKPDSGASTYVCGWVTSWLEPRQEKHGERPKRNEPLTRGFPF